jgi:hypothetical protein
MTGIPKAASWTPAEYDESVEMNPRPFGLSGACLFNELSSFHAVGGFPLDPMHDFFERVGNYDALNALQALISLGLITMEEYNSFMADLPLVDYEVADRPPPVKPSSEKLPGKAMAVSLHIKLMPYAFWWLLDKKRDMESDILDLIFILHRINEYLLADSFSQADIQVL